MVWEDWTIQISLFNIIRADDLAMILATFVASASAGMVLTLHIILFIYIVF